MIDGMRLKAIKDSVIQGRTNAEDEGIDDGWAGAPAVVELFNTALAEYNKPEELQELIEALTAAMQIVGEKFASGDYWIPDMLASAQAVGVAMDILKPYLEGTGVQTKGKFVICTVKGDIHDIGKSIVVILLKGAGYDVIDLGMDVSDIRIVDAVHDEEADFLGMSAMLTTTMVQMDAVIRLLEVFDLRDKVKVLIGGSPVDKEYAAAIGADCYCENGFAALKYLEEATA